MSAWTNILQGFGYGVPGGVEEQDQQTATPLPSTMGMLRSGGAPQMQAPGGMQMMFGALSDLAASRGFGQGGNLARMQNQAQQAQRFNVVKQLEEQRRKQAQGAAAAKANLEAQRWEREFAEKKRQFDMGGATIKELGDGTLVRVDRSGNMMPLYTPNQGGLTPQMRQAQERIGGTLNHLNQYATDNSQLMEHALGPARGGDGWSSLPGQLYGSITAAITGPGGEQTTWEMRDAIAQKVETLAATMKPLIRGKGEGPWTDADQERLVKLTGDLAKSRNAKEFKRRLKGVQDTINAAFGTQIKGDFTQSQKQKTKSTYDPSKWGNLR